MVHIIQYPGGNFGFVGNLPRELGNIIPANTADVMAGRAFKNDDGELVTVKFPSFPNAQSAVSYANDLDVELCNIKGCACRKLFA